MRGTGSETGSVEVLPAAFVDDLGRDEVAALATGVFRGSKGQNRGIRHPLSPCELMQSLSVSPTPVVRVPGNRT